jgi:hypothetical protein
MVMSDFSATDVAFTGLRFVRTHPRTLAVWAGVQIVISLVTGALAVLLLGRWIGAMRALNQPGHPEDWAQAGAVFTHVMPFYMLMIPFGVVFYAVLYATMARAVLEPGEEGVGYIRFGMDEVRQGLLLLLWWVVIIAAEIVIGMVVAIPTGVTYLLARNYTVLALVVSCVLVFLVGLYLAVRLSLSSALTFDTRRINLFGSWALTRGRFWPMLGAYLLVLGLALLGCILAAIVIAVISAIFGGFGALALVFQPNVDSMSAFFLPARLAATVVGAVITPVFWALAYMPGAEIYRQLTRRPDVTFD